MLISEKKFRELIKGLLNEGRFVKDLNFKFSNSSSNNQSRSDTQNDSFESGDGKIKEAESGVKWGESENSEDAKKRKKAWELLSPFLPEGTRLTSCYRNQNDQDNLIKKFKSKYNVAGDDLDTIVANLNKKGVTIIRHVGSGHGGKSNTGAFDLSGNDLDLIWKSVENANKKLVGQAKFADLNGERGKTSIIEKENNSVHVHFNLDEIEL